MDNRNIEYTRVIPRDLFNEAKLLKCMGRLCLLIHDQLTPVDMSASLEGEQFEIGMLLDGSLTIKNLHVNVMGEKFTFKTTYNSKRNYPLMIEYQGSEGEYLVFDESGQFSTEFIEFCNNIEV